MIDAVRLKSSNGLKIGPLARICLLVSLRPLFAILIAVGMLFAPLAMQSGSAMAMAPADHYAQMMEKGHCADQPTKNSDSKPLDKSCCAATCSVAAVTAVSPGQPPEFGRTVDRPSIEQFRHSYLAELATPPPRRA